MNHSVETQYFINEQYELIKRGPMDKLIKKDKKKMDKMMDELIKKDKPRDKKIEKFDKEKKKRK